MQLMVLCDKFISSGCVQAYPCYSPCKNPVSLFYLSDRMITFLLVILLLVSVFLDCTMMLLRKLVYKILNGFVFISPWVDA